jgi:hypothetical protein
MKKSPHSSAVISFNLNNLNLVIQLTTAQNVAAAECDEKYCNVISTAAAQREIKM